MTTGQPPAEGAPARYHAYLLRVWRDSEHTPWRASVTHVGTGAVHRFASPARAWAYIAARLEAPETDATPINPG